MPPWKPGDPVAVSSETIAEAIAALDAAMTERERRERSYRTAEVERMAAQAREAQIWQLEHTEDWKDWEKLVVDWMAKHVSAKDGPPKQDLSAEEGPSRSIIFLVD